VSARRSDDKIVEASLEERIKQHPVVSALLALGAVAGAVTAIVTLAGNLLDDGSEGANERASLEALPLQIGRVGDHQALEATFVAGTGGETIERLTVIEHFAAGEVSESGVALEACGGRDSFVLVLADAQLKQGGEDEAVYAIDQQSPGDFISHVAGYYDSLPNCLDQIQIEIRPALHIEDGASETLNIRFDESLIFDVSHQFPLGGPPTSQQTETGHSLFSADDPYYDAFGIHLAGVAAHSTTGRCGAVALDLRQEIPEELASTTPYPPHGTVGEWLCSIPERPRLLEDL
jgi:hypothetical protein